MTESSGVVTVQSGATNYTVKAEVMANKDLSLHLTCTDDGGAVADVVICFDQGADPVVSATLTRPGQRS